MTTTLYGDVEVDTTECDKYVEAARTPVEGALDKFLAWLRGQEIELVLADARERYIGFDKNYQEVPVAESMLRRIAAEVIEERTALDSSDLGEIVEAWDEAGLSRCVYRYQRCPLPRQTEWDEVWRKHYIVVLPPEWVLDNRSIERLLCDYYGIDVRKRDREQEAILVAYRAAQAKREG